MLYCKGPTNYKNTFCLENGRFFSRNSAPPYDFYYLHLILCQVSERSHDWFLRKIVTTKKDFLPIELFKGEGIKILDQSLLPEKKARIFLKDTQSVIKAIQSLQLRGAPLIGIAGVCGLAIGSSEYGTEKQIESKKNNRDQ